MGLESVCSWTGEWVRADRKLFAYLLMRLVGLFSLIFLLFLFLLLSTTIWSTSTAATRSFEALLNHFLKIDIIILLIIQQQKFCFFSFSSSSFNSYQWRKFHLKINSIISSFSLFYWISVWKWNEKKLHEKFHMREIIC